MTPTNPRHRRTTAPPRRTPVRLRRLPLSSVYRLLEPGPVVVQVGNMSGRDLDKFRAFGLTAIEATMVAAPRIAECYAKNDYGRYLKGVLREGV